MLISDLLGKTGRHKRRKRIGRGIGSGSGKTSGRGSKGMGQHSSDRPHRMNEGGQMPLVRRIPKRGFSNAQFRTEFQVVNVGTLEERFENGAKVTARALKDLGLIHDATGPVKVLGTGDLNKKLDVEATAFSASASEKIARAGGQVRQSEDAKPKKPKKLKAAAKAAASPEPEAGKPRATQEAEGGKKKKSGRKEPGGEKEGS